MRLIRRGLLWASENDWLRSHVARRSFARRAVRRFMPGETAEAALAAAAELGGRGIGTVLTSLGEGVTDVGAAQAVLAEYEALLDGIAARGLDAEVSVKLTHFGIDADDERCARLLERLADRAARVQRFLWIDMEGSAYTDATLALYRRLRARARAVGVCLQANLLRTPADLEALLPLGPAIRLVKGAYSEPATRAHTQRGAVDVAYLGLASRLLRARRDGSVRAVFGTHDLRLVDAIRQRASLERAGIEVHMLYGIRRAEQVRLARDQDVRLRVLISFGPAWYAWFVRRLAEKPSNLQYLLRG